MKKITLAFSLLLTMSLQSQTLVSAYKERVDMALQTNINTYLQEFASFGIKRTGTAANTSALNWIKGKYESFGYNASQIQEDPFTFGTTNSKNLVVTKIGTKYPNTFVIVCGHFDTVTGPGVNDNGSGTSAILEAARILKDIPTEYSIKFIHFSGEEQGLYGSTHFANNVVFSNGVRQFDIKLVFNLDQVGGKQGNNNSSIKCEKDTSGQTTNNAASAAVTQELAVCTSLYSPLQTVISNAYSSDYMPFENNGEIITGFYENTRSNTEHTVNDTYANVDKTFVFNVTKAAIGAIQHFAIATSETLATVDCTVEQMFQSLKIAPNPAREKLNIQFTNSALKNFDIEITDANGKMLIKKKNSSTIDVSKLLPGVYFVTVTIDGASETRKVFIK